MKESRKLARQSDELERLRAKVAELAEERDRLRKELGERDEKISKLEAEADALRDAAEEYEMRLSEETEYMAEARLLYESALDALKTMQADWKAETESLLNLMRKQTRRRRG